MTLIAVGIRPEFFLEWIKSTLIGFVAACPLAYFLPPILGKIVSKITRKN